MSSSGSYGAAELLPSVPLESRALVARLLEEPLLSRRVLHGEVKAHLELFRAAQRGNELLDLRRAESLAERCVQLLDTAENDAPEDHRRLIQTAVRYFVIEDDGDDDMVLGGLDDDEAVVAAVERLLAAAAVGPSSD